MENHLLKAVEQGEALKYEQAKAIDTAEFQSNYLKFKTDNSDTKAINGNKSSTDSTEDSKDSSKPKTNPMAGTGRKNYGGFSS